MQASTNNISRSRVEVLANNVVDVEVKTMNKKQLKIKIDVNVEVVVDVHVEEETRMEVNQTWPGQWHWKLKWQFK